MRFLFVARGVFLALFAIVTWLTLTPNPENVESGMRLSRLIAEFLFGSARHGDKIAHFLAYGALGLSAALARIALFARPWLTVCALALYGAVLEGFQAIGGVREADLIDALANAGGAAAGMTGGLLLLALIAAQAPKANPGG